MLERRANKWVCIIFKAKPRNWFCFFIFMKMEFDLKSFSEIKIRFGEIEFYLNRYLKTKIDLEGVC